MTHLTSGFIHFTALNHTLLFDQFVLKMTPVLATYEVNSIYNVVIHLLKYFFGDIRICVASCFLEGRNILGKLMRYLIIQVNSKTYCRYLKLGDLAAHGISLPFSIHIFGILLSMYCLMKIS